MEQPEKPYSKTIIIYDKDYPTNDMRYSKQQISPGFIEL